MMMRRRRRRREEEEGFRVRGPFGFREGITMYNGVWRVAKLTIPRPSTVGAHSLHFNVHIVERTFLRSWTRMELSSFFIIFQRVDPLSTARDKTKVNPQLAKLTPLTVSTSIQA